MSDLIDRKTAIEAIEKYFGDLEIQGRFDILSIIKKLPSAQPEPRWIPVTEKLPEANEIDEKGFIKAYLVQDARWMDVARWNGDVWIAWGYGTVLKDVTAWMPLPEPWKGEADETD